VATIAPRGPESDAVSALIHLGYSDARAAEAVARATQALGDETEAGALIREALKGMAR
jgi:Holliday junction resolvasome RuvABC DNA-binding subunit